VHTRPRHRTPWQIPSAVTDKSNLALKIRGIRKGDSRLAVSRNRHDCTRHVRDLPCTKYMNISYTPVSAAWWINAVINDSFRAHPDGIPIFSSSSSARDSFDPSSRLHKTIRGLCTRSYIRVSECHSATILLCDAVKSLRRGLRTHHGIAIFQSSWHYCSWGSRNKYIPEPIEFHAII
jgi:hypothetical protein